MIACRVECIWRTHGKPALAPWVPVAYLGAPWTPEHGPTAILGHPGGRPDGTSAHGAPREAVATGANPSSVCEGFSVGRPRTVACPFPKSSRCVNRNEPLTVAPPTNDATVPV